MPLDELADKGPSSSEEVQLAPSDSKFRSLSPSPIPLPTLPSIRSLVHSVSDESVNVDVAASHQSENGSISTVSSLESERAAYEFLAQTPVRSTDAHLVEFSEAMRTVAKALRRVAEGKAAAQAEAAEWKRKYELETAHKHRSKIKGYSSCINNDLDKLVSQLTLETPTSDQLGCCGKHGICAHEILQDEVPGPIPRSNHKVVGRKASFKLSWGCNGDKNGQHKHDFVSFEKGDITTAERSNKQILLKWESPPQTVLFITKPNSNSVRVLCAEMIRCVLLSALHHHYGYPNPRINSLCGNLYIVHMPLKVFLIIFLQMA
ncbi:NAD kinase 1 [Zea mays]|uniref:NAD kinase 1 n=1 Tax=Zea mays TaxID=4577 RepID=A0A1D6N0T0_MAIZE|nr:NAD kinase 1 [Zea mays]